MRFFALIWQENCATIALDFLALNRIDCLEHDNIEFNISGGKIQLEQEEEHRSVFKLWFQKSFSLWILSHHECNKWNRGCMLLIMRRLGGPYLFCRLQESQFTADLRSRSKTHEKASNWFLNAPCLSRGRKQITYYARLFSIDFKIGDMQSQIMPLP